MPMDVAKDVLQDITEGLKVMAFVLEGTNKDLHSLDDILKKLAEKNKLMDSFSSQTTQKPKTLKDFNNATFTGERLPSFEQIAIKHSVTYAVYQENASPNRRLLFIESKRDMKNVKNALQEYTEKSRNRKPSIKVKLAQAKTQSAALSAKNLAKDLSQSMPKPKMPMPKM